MRFISRLTRVPKTFLKKSSNISPLVPFQLVCPKHLERLLETGVEITPALAGLQEPLSPTGIRRIEARLDAADACRRERFLKTGKGRRYLNTRLKQSLQMLRANKLERH